LRELAGEQRSKAFRRNRDATTFLVEIEASKSHMSRAVHHVARHCAGELPPAPLRNSDAALSVKIA